MVPTPKSNPQTFFCPLVPGRATAEAAHRRQQKENGGNHWKARGLLGLLLGKGAMIARAPWTVVVGAVAPWTVVAGAVSAYLWHCLRDEIAALGSICLLAALWKTIEVCGVRPQSVKCQLLLDWIAVVFGWYCIVLHCIALYCIALN